MATEASVEIDGDLFEFDPDDIEWDPLGPILAARRDSDSTLVLDILVKYRIDDDAARATWETPDETGALRRDRYETVAPGTTVGVYEEVHP